MTATKPGRGRPKGTGLDDSAHLDAIARLIAASPGLRPTTAIRDLGITDPSVIRRLRDKYHAAADAMIESLHGAPAGQLPVPLSGTNLPVPVNANARSMAARVRRDHRKVSDVIPLEAVTIPVAVRMLPAPAASTPPSDAVPARVGEVSWPRLMGLSVGVLVSGLEAQASVMAYCLRHAPFQAMMQTQVVLAGAALALAADCFAEPANGV